MRGSFWSDSQRRRRGEKGKKHKRKGERVRRLLGKEGERGVQKVVCKKIPNVRMMPKGGCKKEER